MKHVHTCQMCGAEFIAEGKGCHRYCSNACRAKAGSRYTTEAEKEEHRAYNREYRRAAYQLAKEADALGITVKELKRLNAEKNPAPYERKKRMHKEKRHDDILLLSAHESSVLTHVETEAIPEGLTRDAREARQRGMTYGQMQAERLLRKMKEGNSVSVL